MGHTFLYVCKLCILSMVLYTSTAHAFTLHVGKNHRYSSLQKAIDKAQKGDTIIVHGGTFKEGNIQITTPITLIGKDNPTIDGQMKYEPISVRSPYVKISGFTVKNSGSSSMNDIAGIKIYNTHNVIISDNVIENNIFGIYSQDSKHCTIENNRIRGNGQSEQLSGNGVHAWKCDSLHILGNDIQGQRDGIYLEFVTHTEVRDNLSKGNIRYGLHFMFSHDNGYFRNHFIGNGAGVAVMYTKRVHMKDNVFEQNWGDAAYGLLLKEISDSEIKHNRFIQNTTGIFMEGSNRIEISSNIFESNGWGLRIQSSCEDNLLTNNNFTGNTFDVATNGTLSLNKFSENYWDKYEGYDLNKDGQGDIPFRPVSLFSMVVERYPMAMLLFRSFMVTLFDRTEKVIPSITPEGLKDETPVMKPILL